METQGVSESGFHILTRYWNELFAHADNLVRALAHLPADVKGSKAANDFKMFVGRFRNDVSQTGLSSIERWDAHLPEYTLRGYHAFARQIVVLRVESQAAGPRLLNVGEP